MRKRKYSFFSILLIMLFHIMLVPAAGAVNKIMPVGDSITQGSGSEVPQIEFWVSYRKALYDRLKPAGYVINDELFVGTLISGQSVADFDPDHDGHPGWRADEIVDGRIGSGEGKLWDWLIAEKPNIVLLHIGSNDVSSGNEDYREIERILVEIDDYESTSGNAVWVILALILDRSCDPYQPPCPKSDETTAFNNDVEEFVFSDRQAGGDKIVLVDMQNDAGIDYDRWENGGDMEDDIHPVASGFAKMANLWWSGLQQILPLADAGPDQDVNEFDIVTLNASGSVDPKNGNLSYQWVQTAGTAVVLSDDQAVQPTFDAPDAGLTGDTLTFTLTVTDEDELVSTDEVNIDVAKIAPQANAGPDQTVNESDTVTLDASNSVGVGLTYQWTQTAGTTVTLTGAATDMATFTAPDVGASGETLTFELTVTDDDGIDSTDEVDVVVENIVQANAGPDQTVDESDTVTLDASNSVGVGLTYQWTQTAGTVVSLSDAQAVQPTFTAPDVGSSGETLAFRLTITDANNLEDTDTVNIKVRNPNSSNGGGGGGGGGCFIATATSGSPMTLSSNTPRESHNQIAMVIWKQPMDGSITVLTPHAGHATTQALAVSMAMLICSCVAITMIKPRKRRLKL